MDLNQLIENTQFSIQSIVDILLEKDDKLKQKFVNHPIKNISHDYNQDVQGFISHVYILKIELENGECFEYALKFPSMEHLVRIGQTSTTDIKRLDKIISVVHNLECRFYELFQEQSPIPLPRIFYIKPAVTTISEGLLIMENLVQKGLTLGKEDFLNEEKVWVVVQNLAKFHAFLLTKQDVIPWRGQFCECDYPNVNLRKRLDKLKMTFPGTFDEPLQKLDPIIEDKELHKYWLWKCCDDLILPMVLCHGDLWATNIFWAKDEDGKATDELLGFIDWQLTFEGNPMFDMARMLVLSTEASVRRRIESTLVDFYVENLEKYAIEYGLDVKLNKNHLIKAYNFCMIHQVLCNAGYLSLKKFENEEEKLKIQHIVENIKEALEDAAKNV